jgi:hypothetical protein
LYKCEGFFWGYRTLEEDKVWMASLHLDGAAVQWFFQLERDLSVVSWPHFADYANLRFGPPIRSNTLGELKELQRTGSVEEYQRQFLALVCHCDHLSWQHQIDLFTAGLGQPLVLDVEMQRPANLQTAMSLARAYERRSAEVARAIQASPARPASRSRSQAMTAGPAVAAHPGRTPPPKTEEQSRSRVRGLTPEEIAEKRANGQCYFCPEKFSCDHKCANRGGVFCITAAETEDDDAVTEEDIRISMHALTGAASSDTICLRVQIHGVELTALVDLGSTHTFIHDAVARRLDLAVTNQPNLVVKVANGTRLRSLGICSATTDSIHGEDFSIDCYTLPLDGFDVVLGVQWLKTLGPIT